MKLLGAKQNRMTKAVFICLTIFFVTIYGCEKVENINPDLPSELSKTGIFSGNLSDLNPTSEYVYYELASSLFTDYSEKQRLISVPLGKQLTKIDDGLPSFPEGTAIVKTFYYWIDGRTPSRGKKIIETRVLLLENGSWKVAVYKWNAEQTEGYLLTSGNDEAVNWIDENGKGMVTSYHIPSTKECITCHQSNDKFLPIGPKLYNLNKQVGASNQLEYFQQIGLINTFDVSTVDSLPNYEDVSLSKLERGRAYMEINCAHCHSPGTYCYGSNNFSSLLDLRFHTSLVESGIVNDKSLINDKIISGEMPFIGTSILDDNGIDLIIEYLNSL